MVQAGAVKDAILHAERHRVRQDDPDIAIKPFWAEFQHVFAHVDKGRQGIFAGFDRTERRCDFLGDLRAQGAPSSFLGSELVVDDPDVVGGELHVDVFQNRVLLLEVVKHGVHEGGRDGNPNAGNLGGVICLEDVNNLLEVFTLLGGLDDAASATDDLAVTHVDHGLDFIGRLFLCQLKILEQLVLCFLGVLAFTDGGHSRIKNAAAFFLLEVQRFGFIHR